MEDRYCMGRYDLVLDKPNKKVFINPEDRDTDLSEGIMFFKVKNKWYVDQRVLYGEHTRESRRIEDLDLDELESYDTLGLAIKDMRTENWGYDIRYRESTKRKKPISFKRSSTPKAPRGSTSTGVGKGWHGESHRHTVASIKGWRNRK